MKELLDALESKNEGDLSGYLELRSDDEIRADIKELIQYEANKETLRDKFAAKAMQGILSASFGSVTADDVAHTAYVYADAMLEARKSQKS